MDRPVVDLRIDGPMSLYFLTLVVFPILACGVIRGHSGWTLARAIPAATSEGAAPAEANARTLALSEARTRRKEGLLLALASGTMAAWCLPIVIAWRRLRREEAKQVEWSPENRIGEWDGTPRVCGRPQLRGPDWQRRGVGT